MSDREYIQAQIENLKSYRLNLRDLTAASVRGGRITKADVTA